ncbi:MAG: DUF4125 family protein [Desulfovibrio sp.]|nr:DUF4125 family protein [Desulfovibrio sp.]
MSREELLQNIVSAEWTMFRQVHNVGGEADCQHDPETFEIMRKSQLATWDDELLASYQDDLKQAKEQGRNLLSEKYAWMMEETHPEEFLQLRSRLPTVSETSLAQIQEIVNIHLGWQKELAQKYPCLLSLGRPAEAQGQGMTSLATYLRGELLTYSAKTIALYHAKTLDKAARGENEARANLANQVKAYGFATLEDCEAHLAQKKSHS